MRIVKWIKGLGGNTLYFPGCLTKGVLKEQLDNYKWILNKLGVDFIMLPQDENCCGLPVINAGYKKDARKLAQKNFELFKAKKITKIITNCPSCYHTFKTEYPKLVRDWDIDVEHITQTLIRELKRAKIPSKAVEIVTYHDPCHLGRYEGIYDAPREIIKLLGCELREMRHNKDEAICCGGGGGLRANYNELSKSIARTRVKDAPVKAEKILTPCPLCFKNISSADDKRTEEFSNFVRRRLE